MNNPRITAKDRNGIKGALRRAFSRSDLRKAVLEASVVKGYTDPTRPRVKTWCRCELCEKLEPKSYMEIDHKQPLIPLDKSLEEMLWEEVINRLWCELDNLQSICTQCHTLKSTRENKERRENKKQKKLLQLAEKHATIDKKEGKKR